MKPSTFRRAAVAAGVAASALCATNSPAQSADALLDKLVEKGILTTTDAKELREEMDQGFTKSYQVKSGMPDWVTALKLNGDFRGRYESFYGEGNDFVDRQRFRYRARFGVTAVMLDNFEVGLRLTSSEQIGSFGGDPISGNTTFSDNGSKKYVFFDLAYAKWHALNTKEFSGALTIGKMENPFAWAPTGFAPIAFDADYTPEGAGMNFAWRPDSVHTLKVNGGAFVMDELGADSSDPYMLGAQARWDAVWNKRITSTLGATLLSIQNPENLGNAAVPNINRGNDRTAAGSPAYNFNPVVVDGGLTYTFDEGPLYKQPFPLRAYGEFLINPAAPESAGNLGWDAGITFGKAGKRKTWELTYLYRFLEANAWYEEVVDSDFGALYSATLPNSGFTGVGYGAGTNVRGHILRAAYSPWDPVTLQVTAFLTSLIDRPAGGNDDGMARIQVDAIWKF